MTCFSD
jgi:hypothetical protein